MAPGQSHPHFHTVSQKSCLIAEKQKQALAELISTIKIKVELIVTLFAHLLKH